MYRYYAQNYVHIKNVSLINIFLSVSSSILQTYWDEGLVYNILKWKRNFLGQTIIF